jgi:hypothetical protein
MSDQRAARNCIHHECGRVGFLRRDDAVRDTLTREGLRSAAGRDAPVDDCTFPARLLLDGD